MSPKLPDTAPVAAAVSTPCIVSLGMLVIDIIYFKGSEPILDVVGGSGAYCTLGARLFLPPPESQAVGWVVRSGPDLPSSVEDYLRSLGTTLVLRKEPAKRCTRGELRYLDDTFGPKSFKYLTPPLLTQPEHLRGTRLLEARAYHFLGHPKDILIQIPALLELRASSVIHDRPVIIWEPAPLFCVPENLSLCLDAMKLVDVFSPNHVELAKLFGAASADFSTSATETFAKKCVASGVGPQGSGTVIIRAGERGCCVVSKAREVPLWLPAYYGASEADETDGEVVDATGAGNAFLGGYAVGIGEVGDVVGACCYGAVAASFAVEQIGMPGRNMVDGAERWNRALVRRRLARYRRRLNLD